MAAITADRASNNDTNTGRIRKKLRSIFEAAIEAGQSAVTVVSGDLHNSVNLIVGSHPNQMPSVCNIMHEFRDKEDVVLHVTPSGRSSTLKIKYALPRKNWH